MTRAVLQGVADVAGVMGPEAPPRLGADKYPKGDKGNSMFNPDIVPLEGDGRQQPDTQSAAQA